MRFASRFMISCTMLNVYVRFATAMVVPVTWAAGVDVAFIDDGILVLMSICCAFKFWCWFAFKFWYALWNWIVAGFATRVLLCVCFLRIVEVVALLLVLGVFVVSSMMSYVTARTRTRIRRRVGLLRELRAAGLRSWWCAWVRHAISRMDPLFWARDRGLV